MRKNISCALFFLMCVGLASGFGVSSSQGLTINNFNGNVYDSEGNPRIGVNVTAWVNGTLRGSSVSGNYGLGYESYYNIDVQGDTSEAGSAVQFKVDGQNTLENGVFTPFASNSSFHLCVQNRTVYLTPTTTGTEQPASTTIKTVSSTPAPLATTSLTPATSSTTTSPIRHTSSTTVTPAFTTSTTLSSAGIETLEPKPSERNIGLKLSLLVLMVSMILFILILLLMVYYTLLQKHR